MAYVTYIACDECGHDHLGWVNHTVAISIAKGIARQNGWMITKDGYWYCPKCKRKVRKRKGGSDEQTKASGDYVR